ncbi:MAG: AraC family transcriptional regulator [Myxococcales bacterium]|nr:AraC family transcriptional regulator [Myxococcales bacterium]MCB9713002.1 AraC family transcriptional regulator [Myxococcales bacterium]
MGRRRAETGFYGGPGFSLYHARGAEGQTPLEPHFHDEYLISAQLRGDEQVHVGGKLHRFREGDVALINPQQVHTGNARGDEIEYVSLYVDRELVRRLADELGAPNHEPEFTTLRASRHRDLVGAMANLLALVQHRDQAAADGHDLPSELDVHTALQQVLVWAFEGFSNLRVPRMRSTARVGHRKIARVLDYLRDLPPNAGADEASLDRLADQAELSKYHFVRQFQRSVGMTPGAYLRRMRLCHAARLLRRRDDPIVDIAMAVGFADHPSFSRAFARHMGMTPSQYRALGPL